MGRILDRLQNDRWWWSADILLRAFGLGLCAAGSQWLRRSIRKAPDHGPMPIEILVAFLSWSIGWAFLAEGQSFFRLIHVPGRHAPFSL